MESGVYTALITPFYENGEIDFKAFEKLLEMQLDAKVAGVVVLGTTGENPTLSIDEKQQLVDMCIEKCKNKLSVIVGCGTNNTKATLEEVAMWNKYDIDQLLLNLPCYSKPNLLGLLKHTELVCNLSNHPITVYNIPNRTGLALTDETLKTICLNPKINSIKEASGNLNTFYKMTKTKQNFTVFSGNDQLFLQTLKLGGNGIISVASNLFPRSIENIYKLYIGGNTQTAEKIFAQMQPFLNSLFIETNPVPIKYYMSKIGLCTPTVRLPLGPLLDKSKDDLDNMHIQIK